MVYADYTYTMQYNMHVFILLTKALPFSVDTKNFITEATFEIFANLGNWISL